METGRKPYRRKRPKRLATMIREAALMRRYRDAATDAALDYDWAAIRHNRAAVVGLLMSVRGNGDYLEIGCASNLLFDTVAARTKIGVDPAAGGTHRMTSDAFFAANDRAFDVIFIDGLHVYDQVRRDLVHALAALKRGGFIALHDMLPRDWIEEHVPQISTGGWTGDGWKVAFELAASPGIEFRLAALDHGVLVARPTIDNPPLADLGGELGAARFATLHARIGELPVVDWEGLRSWIEGFGGRS